MLTSDVTIPAAKSLKYVDLLMSESEQVYNRLVESHLSAFTLTRQDKGDRIVPAPDGTIYAAMYQVFVWEADDNRRLVWFSLESQIPHMSSIVACIGFPAKASCLPVLVINMNLKRHLGSYGTIVGVRGGPESTLINNFIPASNPTWPKPLIVKEWPQGFRGIRLIFELSESVIEWSLSTAECAVVDWLKASEGASASVMDGSTAQAEVDPVYAQEMKELHQDGGVFDAVFGDEWVSRLFNESVFKPSQSAGAVR
jgi:hypothetical protein